MCAYLKENSPVHDKISGKFILPQFYNKNEQIKNDLLKEVSRKFQDLASLSVKNTYLSWIKACVRAINDSLTTHYVTTLLQT